MQKLDKQPREVKKVGQKLNNLQQGLSNQTMKKRMKGPECALRIQGCLQVKQKENASQREE